MVVAMTTVDSHYREEFEASNASRLAEYQIQLAEWKAYERERVI